MTQSAITFAQGFYHSHHRRLRLWAWLLAAVLAALLARELMLEAGLWVVAEGTPASTVLLAILLASLVCEYIDSSLGMGFGTTLTPILLLAGFEPLLIVPAVLCSELVSGLAAGVMHQRDGNIDLLTNPRARRTLLLLSVLSAAGALAAVLIAVRIPTTWLTAFIVTIVLAMGLITLASTQRPLQYRGGGILTIGLIAAFNKGMSGGGYGPLVTSGQLVCGMPAKEAVAITSIAEAFTCLVGLTAYMVLRGMPDWSLTLPLMAGALLAVPLATATVKRLSERHIRLAVGGLTLILGLVLLAKLLS